MTGKGHLPFAGGTQDRGAVGVYMCTDTTPESTGNGLGVLICCGPSVWDEALPQAAVLLSRQSHKPFCGSEVLLPRLSTELFVTIENGQWTSSARLGLCTDWGRCFWSGVPGVLLKHCAPLRNCIHNPAHYCAGIAEGKTWRNPEEAGNAEELSDIQSSSPVAQTP